MPIYKRKVNPKVNSGKVQKKNNHRLTALEGCFVDRESPLKGFRHVVTKRDVFDFIDLIPEWETASRCVRGIVLSCGEDWDGLYETNPTDHTGLIRLSAWYGDLWTTFMPWYFQEHKHLFDFLGVAYNEADDEWECRFSLKQAKAFMLLHVFMHELGHHVDRMSTRHQRHCTRGERFAETYANDRFNDLFPAYEKVFGKVC